MAVVVLAIGCIFAHLIFAVIALIDVEMPGKIYYDCFDCALLDLKFL